MTSRAPLSMVAASGGPAHGVSRRQLDSSEITLWRRRFDSIPVAMYEEDYSKAAESLEALRREGVTDLTSYLTERPDELERLISLIVVEAANAQAIRLVGAEREEQLVGSLPPEMFKDRTRHSFIAQFQAIWDGKDHVAIELHGQPFGGESIDCVMNWAAPVLDTGPDYAHVQVGFLDVTARVRAERIAIETAAKLSQLYEIGTSLTASLDVEEILAMTLDGAVRLVDADKVALFMFDHDSRQITQRMARGIDSDELAQHTYDELEAGITGSVWRDGVGTISEDIASDMRNTGLAYERALSHGRWSVIVAPLIANDQVFGTLTAVREAGSETPLGDNEHLYVEMLASQASIAIENAQLYSGLRDTMSELQRTQASLLSAQKLEAVGQLAAGVAHEINTPVQFVSDNLRFMKDAFSDVISALQSAAQITEAVKSGTNVDAAIATHESALEDADFDFLVAELPDAIEQSLDGVERVAVIVRALKEFSHPGGEQLSPVDINRALENTLAVARNEWKYVAEAVTNLDPAVGCIPALSGPLNQVILNLLVNAAHAIGDVVGDSGDLGTITVTTRQDCNYAEIRIQDTGGGIPEHIRDRIYDPFFTTKDVGRGTGQGLAIAHDIITVKHGGELTFEVEEGVGTTFIIRLPVEPPDGEACE